MELVSSRLDEVPQLVLEYMPKGTLYHCHHDQNMSPAECLSVLEQCLDALAYLHERKTPIVHRDIKAANILVASRDSSGICVKLADFGLSKEDEDLSTILGTPPYFAPEMLQKAQHKHLGLPKTEGYGPKVDVWALGVVICEYLCRLPKFDRQKHLYGGTIWGETIIAEMKETLERQPDELLQFLLDTMVVMDPEERWTARDCFEKVERGLVPTGSGSVTPKTCFPAGEDELSTSRYQTQAEASTIRADAGRVVRFNAPSRSIKRPTTMSSEGTTKRSRVESTSMHNSSQQIDSQGAAAILFRMHENGNDNVEQAVSKSKTSNEVDPSDDSDEGTSSDYSHSKPRDDNASELPELSITRMPPQPPPSNRPVYTQPSGSHLAPRNRADSQLRAVKPRVRETRSQKYGSSKVSTMAIMLSLMVNTFFSMEFRNF